MSITATHTDPKITTIRSIVEAKNSRVPFLLLPVRIETRFMKVSKPATSKVDESLLGELLVDLSKVDELLLQPIHKMNATELKTIMREVSEVEKKFRTNAKSIKPINKEQKEWLNQIQTNITKRISLVSSSLPRTVAPNVKKISTRLKNAIKAIDHSAPPITVYTNEFMSSFASLEKELQALHLKHVPYTSKEKKKKLYAFITKKIDVTKAFYETALDKIVNVQKVESNQLEKADLIHQKIQRHIFGIEDQLLRLHNDNNWRAFIQSTQHQANIQFKPLFANFESQVLKQLKDKSEEQIIDSNQYLFTSLNLKRNVIQFQNTDQVNVKEVKALRKAINNRVKKLDTYQNKKLIGSKDQKDKLELVWRQINKDLSSVNDKIAQKRPPNSNQKFGLNQSRQVIKNVATNEKINFSQNVNFTFSTSETQAKTFKLAQDFTGVFQSHFKQLSERQKITEDHLKQLTIFKKDLEAQQRKKIHFSDTDKNSISAQAVKLQRSATNNRFESQEVRRQYVTELAEINQIITTIDEQQVSPSESITFVPSLELKEELWLRIYPDDIFIHTHEEQLTEQEIRDGKRYWKTLWAVNYEKGLSLGAWRGICASYGSKRAAWIVNTVESAKVATRARIETSPSKLLTEAIEHLHATVELLKPIKNDTPFKELRNMIDLTVIQEKLLVVLSKYESLVNKPQLVYFMEKAIGKKQSIYSKLQLLVKITNNNTTERGFQTTSTQLNKVIDSYEKIHEVFQKIPPIRLDQLIDLHKDPFQYKASLLKLKEKEWSTAPHSKVLPKHFVVVAKNNDSYQIIHTGNPIPENLQMGLDPSKFDFEHEDENPFQTDAEGNLTVDEGMKWMVDFPEAVKKGMGMVIPLTETQAKDGFDLLYVVGVHETSSTLDQAKLEELFQNHHHAALGMEFLKIGTATNNTSDSNAGFSLDDIDAKESQRIEIQDPLFQVPAASDSVFTHTDGYRFANSLGVKADTFYHINNSNLTQISNGQAMHKALWHATIGNFMEEMLDKLFTYDNISRTKDFFTENIIGRGYLPPIRIGRQPYGVLPTTSYKKIRFSNTFSEVNLPTLTQAQLKNPTSAVHARLDFRFNVRLKKLLNKLDYEWRQIREQEVNHAGNMEEHDDPQAAFVNMLGLTANSSDFYFRYGVNINDRASGELGTVGTNFADSVTYSPTTFHIHFMDFVKGAYFTPSFEYQDEISPYDDEDRQTTSINSRIKDQFFSSRIFTFRYLNRHSFVNGIWVNEDENESELPKIIDGKNYIEWLLDPGHNVFFDLFNNNDFEALPSNSILFLLLRHSLLLSYREAGLQICQSQSLMGEEFRRLLGAKESYIDYTHTRFRTKWTHLLRRLIDLEVSSFYNNGIDYEQSSFYNFLKNKGNKSVADYVHDQQLRAQFNGHSNHVQFINGVQDTKDAMAHLASLQTDELALLLSEHLDVSTYRLDAWISGLANRRLKESRAKQKTGIFIGAYGWIENLRPGGERKEAAKLPDGFVSQKETVYTDEDNEGYIHAPSINHAISAAILRAGYLANDDAEGDLTNRMAVNLSSARVRKALHLIEGLRGGLDLPALLGYQFERGLHERYKEVELDKFILPFRKKFPLTVPVEVQGDEKEVETLSSVVHGVNLLEAITSEIDEDAAAQASLYDYLTNNKFENCPDWLQEFVPENSQENEATRDLELKTIIKELDEMADAFDALGDLAISESVYQIVNGNHVRAAAVLTALGEGTLMPEPQIAATPRSGTVVTQKVLLQLEPSTGLPSGWGTSPTPRATAEPTLNHWIADTIGDPSLIRCLVSSQTDTYSITYAELDIQPIDLLYMMSSNKDQGNSDIADIVKHRIRTNEGLSNEVELTVHYNERSEVWSKETKSFYEVDLILYHIKAMIHDAKPIGYTDVSMPEEEPNIDNPDQYDLSELTSRVSAIVGKAKQDLNNMQSFIDAKTELTTATDFTSAYNHLLKAIQYGIVNTLAQLPVVDNAAHSSLLLDRIKKTIERLTERVAEAEAHQQKSNEMYSTYQKVAEQIAAAKSILTKNFTILPLYETSNKIDINTQLNASQTDHLLRNSTATLPMEEWLQSVSDVRTKLYHYEMVSMAKNVTEVTENNIQPIQFPYQPGDYWLGQEFPEEYDPREDKLSIVFIQPNFATTGEKQAGILIDEWVEIIPEKKQTTGITFQYDQPDATPPQSLLLAVSPNPITNTSKWEWDDLCYILEDTFSLAKNRTVEPDHLENSMFGQVLPAIVTEVIPPQIIGEEDDDDENLMGSQVILDFATNLQEEETD